jgi:hypothetical protein
MPRPAFPLPIADCQLPTADLKARIAASSNRQLEIGNRQSHFP